MISFSIQEIIDLVLMSLILGVIFKDLIPMHMLLKKKQSSPFNLELKGGQYHYKSNSFFNKILGYFDNDYWFSILVIAPAIVLHELSHKVVAQLLGLNATFYAAYKFLAFALIMKLIFPFFIFFVPGYVMTMCTSAGPYCIATAQGFMAKPFALASVAIAGPLANLVIYGIATYMIKSYAKNTPAHQRNKTYLLALVITQKLNIFLFILNMLPIPGFDGWHFFTNLFKLF